MRTPVGAKFHDSCAEGPAQTKTWIDVRRQNWRGLASLASGLACQMTQLI